MTITLRHGDMRVVLDGIPSNTFDACITDPPYHLTSVVKRFGATNAAPAQHGKDGLYARASAGFMGKTWDGGDIAFRPETWTEVLRVLKPGAHLLAFGGTRTFHRMAVAIEDAGFEIRDTLLWLYGTGFPKSHDVARSIDKLLGVQGGLGEPRSAAHAGWIERGALRGTDNNGGWQRPWMGDATAVDAAARQYVPGSREAAAWQGWGTALKPAWEPIIMARVPLDGTVAQNVLAHGSGGLNIDACRIEAQDVRSGGFGAGKRPWQTGDVGGNTAVIGPDGPGRWPANVAHDGSDEVEAAFASFGEKKSGTGAIKRATAAGYRPNALGSESRPVGTPNVEYGDTGSASRFFYSAKATAADRAGSKHPTVKPVSLLRWLTRLVLPPGGLVLDPFAGSGTTGAAVLAEGGRAVLVENDGTYYTDIQRRFGQGVFA